jgi:hypothetical protein
MSMKRIFAGVICVLVAPVLATGPVFAEDREAIAKRLFVEAAKLQHSGPCDQLVPAGLVIWLDAIFGPATDEKIACARRLRDAAVIHQEILADYPETEAAFTLAAQGYQTPKQLDTLLEILTKKKLEREVAGLPKPRKRPELKEPPRINDEPEPVSRQVSAFEQNDMVRAIQQQLFSCWRLDPGAVAAEDMVVEIRVALNPDGSIQRADVIDVARMSRDGYFRSAAENARRAIYKCSPFRLPPNKYQIWRELSLRFNPREMFGT